MDLNKPIILTHNGQNQGEMSALLLKRDADLPFLRNRLHLPCQLWHEGFVQRTVQKELIAYSRRMTSCGDERGSARAEFEGQG